MKKRVLAGIILFILGIAFFISLIFPEKVSITGFASGFLNIDLGLFNIDIDSPENITYYFAINYTPPYPLDLNVSSDEDIYSWWYTLIDLKHGYVVYENVSFTPNSSINASRWSNQLIVFGNNSGGIEANGSVIFFIFVNNSPPIMENISYNYTCEGRNFYWRVYADDTDEDNLISDIFPKNPFYTTNLGKFNYTRDLFAIFSGTLTKDNAGGIGNGSKIHELNVTINDGEFVDSKRVNITIIEINNAPAVGNIGVQTVWTVGDNSTFYHQITVDDIEDGNESDNLNTSISFSNQSLFNISSNWTINYTGNTSDLGVHNVSICITDNGIPNPDANISVYCNQDGSNSTTCENFTLTVTDENRPPVIINYTPTFLVFSAVGENILNFNITKYDPDGPAIDTYWYVNDVPKEYDEYQAGVSSDTFNYAFDCDVYGNHTVKVVITDGELNDSLQWNISVTLVPCPVGPSRGGGGALVCEELWACDDWSQCKNLKYSLVGEKIAKYYEVLIKERCSLFNWNDDVCGFQIRNCTDVNLCGTNFSKPGFIKECYYTEFPTCDDGIKNCHQGSCEILVDCGGPCPPCPTCSDGILNHGEEGIDCGGPCPPCEIERPAPFSIKTIIFFGLLIMFLLLIVLVVLMVVRYHKRKKILEKISRKKAPLSR